MRGIFKTYDFYVLHALHVSTGQDIDRFTLLATPSVLQSENGRDFANPVVHV